MIYTQGRELTLNTVPGLLVSLLHQGLYHVRWRQQGRHVKSQLEKLTSSIVVKSLDVPPKQTHLYPLLCLDTSNDSSGCRFIVSLWSRIALSLSKSGIT
jgi:hypothetical protein